VPSTVALRHVPFETLGLLAPLLEQRGHAVSYVDVPVDGVERVDSQAPDLLVVLGGPIGVYENDDYPFIDAEVALIEKRIARDMPLLGICLGSQLMAKALGARVYPSGVKEIGWAPIDLTDEGRASCLRHLEHIPVLHWHGDTFDLPAGATRLASTPACANQAFSYGASALALQFHAETAGVAVEGWLVGHTGEIARTPGISVQSLRADTARCTPGVERTATACFAEWLTAAGL
jgi:GMP synthase (glutamine-hydrolysing)